MSEEVATLWQRVRTSSDSLRWIIATVNDKSNGLTVVASGSTGYTAFMAKLKETTGIVHAGIKITGVDERGAVKSIRSQFVKISMMTDGVPQLKRAKSLQLKDEIDRAFSGANVVFDVSNVDEIAREEVVRRLESAAGAHKPGRYDFEGVEDDQGGDPPKAASPTTAAAPAAEKKPQEEEPSATEKSTENKEDEEETKKKVAEGEAAAPVEGGESGAAAAATEANAEPAAAAPSPAPPVDDEPLTIESAWKRVQDEKHPFNFLIVACDGKDAKSGEIVKAGTGSLEEFKSFLEEDRPMYAGFRLRAIDDRGSVVSVRPKLLFVTMVGKQVRPVVKAQASSVKQQFEQIFNGAHITVFVESPEELTEADLITRLRQSGGAHQPNRYDFGGKKGQEV